MAREVFRVDGLKELDRTLKTLPARVADTFLLESLEHGAEVIAEQATANAPYDPTSDGPHLKDNIGVGNAKRKRAEASVDVGVDYRRVKHGHLVEFGHRGGAKPHPFMRPAFDARVQEAITRFQSNLWRLIRGAIRGRR